MSNETIRNTLVLKLLFSGFSYPQESRFVKIFLSQSTIIPLKSSIVYKKKKKNLNIETANVENGKR